MNTLDDDLTTLLRGLGDHADSWVEAVSRKPYKDDIIKQQVDIINTLPPELEGMPIDINGPYAIQPLWYELQVVSTYANTKLMLEAARELNLTEAEEYISEQLKVITQKFKLNGEGLSQGG